MAEIVQIIFATSTGGILGYLFKTQIEHRLAIARINENIRITEYNKATGQLRAAFALTLASIYLAKKHGKAEGSPPDVDKILRDAIPSHAAAVEMFRVFVPQSKRTPYQEAWEKYRYEVSNYGFDATTFREDVADPWKVFDDLIHNILLFADDS